MPFALATGVALATASRTTSAKAIGRGDNCSAPAWIRLSSNKSSTILASRSTSTLICGGRARDPRR